MNLHFLCSVVPCLHCLPTTLAHEPAFLHSVVLCLHCLPTTLAYEPVFFCILLFFVSTVSPHWPVNLYFLHSIVLCFYCLSTLVYEPVFFAFYCSLFLLSLHTGLWTCIFCILLFFVSTVSPHWPVNLHFLHSVVLCLHCLSALAYEPVYFAFCCILFPLSLHTGLWTCIFLHSVVLCFYSLSTTPAHEPVFFAFCCSLFPLFLYHTGPWTCIFPI